MCSVYTEGYFGVAPIELEEVFADSLSLFLFFLSSYLLIFLLAFLSSQVFNSIIERGLEKVSLHRLITKGYEFDDNNFFFLFSNRSLGVRNNQESMKFIEFYRISSMSSTLLKNSLFAENSLIILSLSKIIFFNQLFFRSWPDPDRNRIRRWPDFISTSPELF